VLKSLSVSLYERERLTFPPLKKGDKGGFPYAEGGRVGIDMLEGSGH